MGLLVWGIVTKVIPGSDDTPAIVETHLRSAYKTAAQRHSLDYYDSKQQRVEDFLVTWIKDGLNLCWHSIKDVYRFSSAMALEIFDSMCECPTIFEPALGTDA